MVRSRRSQRRVTHQARAAASRRSPDLGGDVNDQTKLAALIVDSNRVADVIAGKSALWAQRELFQCDEFGSFRDPAFDVFARLKRWVLAGQKAEDHHLVLRHEPQRLEAAGAGRVVFEKKCIDVELLEQSRRDEIITTFGAPMAAGIPAAD